MGAQVCGGALRRRVCEERAPPAPAARLANPSHVARRCVTCNVARRCKTNNSTRRKFSERFLRLRNRGDRHLYTRATGATFTYTRAYTCNRGDQVDRWGVIRGTRDSNLHCIWPFFCPALRLSRGCCPAGSSVKERGQIQIPPFPPPCGAQTKEGHSYSSITPNSRPRGCGEDSLLVARSGYRAALNGSELRRNAGRVMPARGACTRQTATEGGTRRGRVNTPVLVGEVRGSGAERPRLVQAQCWCPRDVGREGWCVA